MSPRSGSVLVLIVLSAAAAGFSAAHSGHPGTVSLPATTIPATTVPATTGPGTSPASAFCQDPGRLTGMSVTRTEPPPVDQITFTFPDHVVSSDRPAIAAVARTLCSLPPFPTGAFGCPADFGTSYLIVFTAGAAVVATVSADPNGCSQVTGLGTPRAASGAFWASLAVALDLPAPRQYCDPFTGQLPNSPTQCGAVIQ